MAIVLNSKTYTAVGFDPNGVSLFSEVSGGVPSSFSKLTDKVNLGNGSTSTTVKWKLAMPVVVAADSTFDRAGTLLRTYYASIEVSVPPGSTATERTDFQARLTALAAKPEFTGSITALAQA